MPTANTTCCYAICALFTSGSSSWPSNVNATLVQRLWKTNCIHWSMVSLSVGNWEMFIAPSQQKTNSFQGMMKTKTRQFARSLSLAHCWKPGLLKGTPVSHDIFTTTKHGEVLCFFSQKSSDHSSSEQAPIDCLVPVCCRVYMNWDWFPQVPSWPDWWLWSL